MKILVEHDGNGNIHAVGVVKLAAGLQVIPTARPGNTVSLVEVPGLVGEPGNSAFDKKIESIMKLFAVQVGPAKLVKKSSREWAGAATGTRRKR